ncbi:glycoside hydrolase family 5 protein [Noviherbaspirillum sp. UKPF54]|uniref:glycoside hydrolase family 5 protein n=1 Tax=Noviherbaspirillum sp. UKPF54 TaxID=2601898 RepID=UPI0011B127F7|nr:cellulase family glycosylhydrolase [Noviherbaspirillum sp. UKPF54]QDZ26832.1 glycoside hydrolase family 5 protein [Noviherbaspirillum sp. UKPF54]
MSDEAHHSPGRRAVLISLLGAVASAACGGGGGNSPQPAPPTSAGTSDPPPAPVSRLALNGSSMLAPDGTPVILRGINEGTWGEMRSYDAATIAAQGGQVVRVLIRWWGLYGGTDVESRADPSPGHFKPDHLSRFLQEIQWCIDAGLWVIPVIDSNCGQNGLQDAAMAQYCDPSGTYPGGRNFWTDLAQRQLFKEAWVYLAGILKDYPKIAFYELLPEPLAGRDSSYGDDVSAFYQELMAAIEDQAGDKRTPILVGPRDAYNINLCDEAYIADPRWTNRVVYTGNLFIRTNQTQQQNIANLESRLGALVNMKTARNVPVFIQQFGVRSGDDPDQFYLDAGLSRLNAAGVGYTGWQWRQNTSSPSEYAVVIEDATTGADVVKTAVLAVYSKYWKA